MAYDPREGVRFLWQHRLLRLMALSLTVLSACWGAWLALIPLIATDRMGLDARGYGILLSALGAGGMLGALTVTTINRVLGRRWSMFADLLGTAVMVATPVLSTNLWVVSGGAFFGGMGGILWTVNSRTINQRLVDDSMLGRYNAAARLFSWGAMPVGAGLVGVLAEWFGIRAAFTVFTLATLVIIVPFLRPSPQGAGRRGPALGAGLTGPRGDAAPGSPAPLAIRTLQVLTGRPPDLLPAVDPLTCPHHPYEGYQHAGDLVQESVDAGPHRSFAGRSASIEPVGGAAPKRFV
ncbi:MFS transporter [Streptomyces sp. NPDC050610]|uniref:MFS transporter n=1 Tax=Streptomyces sp. NPDC050610 TaxID=3157097 RepID=UPI00341BB3AF